MKVYDKILERMEAATCVQRVHLYSDRLINPKVSVITDVSRSSTSVQQLLLKSERQHVEGYRGQGDKKQGTRT